MIVSFEPITQREKQIANSLGAEGWFVIQTRDSVFCFEGNPPGTLISKNGHVRWVRTAQIKKTA
jgi:hypothetical protein